MSYIFRKYHVRYLLHEALFIYMYMYYLKFVIEHIVENIPARYISHQKYYLIKHT